MCAQQQLESCSLHKVIAALRVSHPLAYTLPHRDRRFICTNAQNSARVAVQIEQKFPCRPVRGTLATDQHDRSSLLPQLTRGTAPSHACTNTAPPRSAREEPFELSRGRSLSACEEFWQQPVLHNALFFCCTTISSSRSCQKSHFCGLLIIHVAAQKDALSSLVAQPVAARVLPAYADTSDKSCAMQRSIAASARTVA